MTRESLLMNLAAAANQAGYLVPAVDSEQAHRAADALLAAVGLTRAAPQPALPPRPEDGHTRMLPIYQPARAPVPPRGTP